MKKLLVLLLCLSLSGCEMLEDELLRLESDMKEAQETIYTNEPYLLETKNYETAEVIERGVETVNSNLTEGCWFSGFDELGRTQNAYAVVGPVSMSQVPDREGSLTGLNPSGWNGAINYKQLTGDSSATVMGGGQYIYNRCHLIGYQFFGPTTNTLENLVTGTRNLNINLMLPNENLVANHVKQTNHLVEYWVEPKYVDNELVCRQVRMAAKCEQNDFDFDVILDNIQPEVNINYSDGTVSLK